MRNSRERQPWFWGGAMGGVAAAVASQSLPFAFVVPALPLIAALFVRPFRNYIVYLAALCWSWMFACAASAGGSGGWAAWLAPLLMAAGVLLDARFFFRTAQPLPSSGIPRPVAALLAGGASLAVPALLIAAVGRGTLFCIFLPALALLGWAGGWLFFSRLAPQRSGENSVLLNSIRLGMAAALAAWALRLGMAGALSVVGAVAAQRGRTLEAAASFGRSARMFEALAVKRPALSALSAMADMEGRAGLNRERLETLERIVRLAPGEPAARRQLFEAAVESADAASAHRWFDAGFADTLSRDALALAASGAVAAEDWPAVCAVLSAPAGAGLEALFDEPALLKTAQRLYFAGCGAAAERLLREAVRRNAGGWDAARLLCWLLLARGDTVGARDLLARDFAAEDSSEKAYFLSLAAAPEPAAACGEGVFFEGGAVLEEASLASAVLRPGASARVKFRWRLLEPFDPRLRVFLHFRRRLYGGSMFQGDHFLPPFDGIRALPAGGTSEYELDTAVPPSAPPGDYAVYAGLWDSARRRRVRIGRSAGKGWTVTHRRDAVFLGRVRVER